MNVEIRYNIRRADIIHISVLRRCRYAQSDPVEAEPLPLALMGNYTLPDKMEKFLQPERSAPLDDCNMSIKGEMLYIWTG